MDKLASVGIATASSHHTTMPDRNAQAAEMTLYATRDALRFHHQCSRSRVVCTTGDELLAIISASDTRRSSRSHRNWHRLSRARPAMRRRCSAASSFSPAVSASIVTSPVPLPGSSGRPRWMDSMKSRSGPVCGSFSRRRRVSAIMSSISHLAVKRSLSRCGALNCSTRMYSAGSLHAQNMRGTSTRPYPSMKTVRMMPHVFAHMMRKPPTCANDQLWLMAIHTIRITIRMRLTR
mmetsp:Transcript_31/g.111  ORF Transcript_31/g.111 Transcript_31/m.111 type:complete len:235 (-) Transcript_31:542-1246(-)